MGYEAWGKLAVAEQVRVHGRGTSEESQRHIRGIEEEQNKRVK